MSSTMSFRSLPEPNLIKGSHTPHLRRHNVASISKDTDIMVNVCLYKYKRQERDVSDGLWTRSQIHCNLEIHWGLKGKVPALNL